jgi:hypothetical protein
VNEPVHGAGSEPLRGSCPYAPQAVEILPERPSSRRPQKATESGTVTVAGDHAAQEAAWFDAPDYDRNPRSSIRPRLTAGHVPGTDRRRCSWAWRLSYEAGTDLTLSKSFSSSRVQPQPSAIFT